MQRVADRREVVRCGVVGDIPTTISLASGMFAGAIGVGVAYPFDTIKVKMQAYNGERSKRAAQGVEGGATGGGGGAIAVPAESLNAFSTARLVLRNEGPAGFYGGVSTTMAGQALIKGMLFFVYDLTKSWLVGQPWACSSVCSIGGVLPLFPSLAIAAAISGAAASFVCTPVERIKCVMQASEKGAYASPTACIGRVIEEDGVSGLLGRGLLVTLFREIPSYVGYLLGYEFMKSFLIDTGAVPLAVVPIIGGAFAGVMSWVPVYPIDVVKTNIQAKEGGETETPFEVAVQLFKTGGVMVFWDGLSSKVLRAVVNHAVTFLVFEALCDAYKLNFMVI